MAMTRQQAVDEAARRVPHSINIVRLLDDVGYPEYFLKQHFEICGIVNDIRSEFHKIMIENEKRFFLNMTHGQRVHVTGV